MEQIEDFGDERVSAWCSFCSGRPETRDHIPPKVFLDEPLPKNVHVVGACWSCNNATSRDEEYVACLVECARLGSTEVAALQRLKVQRVFEKRPALAARIRNARSVDGPETSFAVEIERVRRVLSKLVRAHARFEENVATCDTPTSFAVVPLLQLSSAERERFEAPPDVRTWPEVGSRAMQRILLTGDHAFSRWVEVQPDRYRFLTASSPLTVRIVMSEYLACEAVWE